MEFKNETWRKIRVRKETDKTPTPLITVRRNDVVVATSKELIEEYKEAGLTPLDEEAMKPLKRLKPLKPVKPLKPLKKIKKITGD